MTVSELAKKLGVHRNNIVYWISTGRIEARRMGLAEKSPYLIPIAEAERVIKEYNSPNGNDQ
jgi:excisionase family DNA binding protein